MPVRSLEVRQSRPVPIDHILGGIHLTVVREETWSKTHQQDPANDASFPKWASAVCAADPPVYPTLDA